MSKANIIVVSNEKGGTGKSTIAMHLAIACLKDGLKIATVDLDGRQGSLSKYIENRQHYCAVNFLNLLTPQNFKFEPKENVEASKSELKLIVETLADKFDAIIIDTAGNKNYLFEEAYKYADTLITPVGDSLIDLNVFAEIDFANKKIGKPSHYANFVWEMKKYLAAQGKPCLNWIVTGNKISSLKSNNKQVVFDYLGQMAKLYGFRLIDGLKDRVIYKELFLEGLTVYDLDAKTIKKPMTLSHLAAKRELRALAEFICPQE